MSLDDPLRRRAAELLVARTQWQQLADALFDAILITDAEGRIVMVNQLATSLFRYPMSAMLGHMVEEFMPERFRAKHPGYRSKNYGGERRFMGRGVELFILTREQKEVPVDIGLSDLIAEEGSLTVVTIRAR